jgi:hypothetical protein
MPKDFLVQAAQAYIAQPTIQIGYKTRSGGVGTVSAIVMLHPIEIAQARSSTTNRKRLDVQSSRIQSMIPDTTLIKESCPQFRGCHSTHHALHWYLLTYFSEQL